MNFTKKSIAVLLSLAIVFTTLVCMSVSASMDLPIPNSIVTYSSGSATLCKQNTPEYIAEGKIAHVDVTNVANGDYAKVISNTAELTTLVTQAKSENKMVCIDLYSEIVSKNSTKVAPISLNYGGGLLTTTAENSNVPEPSKLRLANFVSDEVVTIKIPAENFATDYGKTDANLTSMTLNFTASDGDIITGSFWISVPYLEGTASTGTVPVTSFRTTTTKANADNTDNTVEIFETPVKYTSFTNHATSKVLMGDLGGQYEGKYMYVFNASSDGQYQQVQSYVKMEGFDTLYQQAVDEGKDLCLDVYVNPEFNNGGSTTKGWVDFRPFYGGKALTSDKEGSKFTLTSGQKRTLTIPTTEVADVASALTSVQYQFNNYSYAPYYIKNATFIMSVPYLEGAASIDRYKESTTSTTTTTAKANESWDGKSNVAIYDNDIVYTGASGGRGNASLGYDETYGNKYFYAYGAASYEYGGSQMSGSATFENEAFAALVQRAREEKKSICMDVYANDFSDGGTSTVSGCYFRVNFNGCKATGDKDRRIASLRKQTMLISPYEENGYVSESCTKVSYTFLNYSEGGKRINNGKFVISVPYLEGEEPATTINVVTPTTKSPDYTPDTEALPITAPETEVKLTDNWANSGCSQGTLSNGNLFWLYTNGPATQMQFGSKKMTNFAALVKRAKELGTTVKIDAYGEFRSSSSEPYADMKVAFGGKEIQKEKLVTNQLKTYEFEPSEIINSLTPTQAVVVPGAYQAEKLPQTGTLQSDGTHSENGVVTIRYKKGEIGDYVEYTISDLSAGEYTLYMDSRDYKGRAYFKATVNDVEYLDEIDMNVNTAAVRSHDLGGFTVANDNDPVTIRLEISNQAATPGDFAAYIDKFVVARTDGTPLPTEATTTLSEDEILAKATSVNMTYQRNQNYSTWGAYGFIYFTAPYIDIPESESSTTRAQVSGMTTTTTTAPPTNRTDSMPSGGWDPDKIDWPTDTQISVNWAASSGEGISKASADTLGKWVRCELQEGTGMKQCSVNLKLKYMDWLLEQAKPENADAAIAFDVYPKFGNTTQCYMRYCWSGAPMSGEYDHVVTTNKPITIRTMLDDMPDTTPANLTVTLQNYSFGNARFENCYFYVSAPYLYEPKNDVVARTDPTTSTTTTTTLAQYPSINSGNTKFTIGSVSSKPGASVKVPINIEGNAGLVNSKFTVTFDSDNLYYSGFEAGNVFDKVNVGDNEVDDGILNVLLEQNSRNTVLNGVVVYLCFDAPENSGEYPMHFAGSEYDADNFYDENFDNVACSFISGEVNVTTGQIITAQPTTVPDYSSTVTATSTNFYINIKNLVVNGSKNTTDLSVKVNNNKGIKAAKLIIEFDSTGLKLNEFLNGEVFNDVSHNESGNTITVDLAMKNGTASSVNGELFTLAFEVLDITKVSQYVVKFGGRYNAANIIDINNNAVESSFTNGLVNVRNANDPDMKQNEPTYVAPTTQKPTNNVTPATPKIQKTTLSAKKAVKIVWSKSSNATSYQVFRAMKGSNNFVRIAQNVKTTQYTDKSVKAGKSYVYRVRAVNQSKLSNNSNTKTISVMKYSTKASLKKLVSKKSKTLKVSLKKKIVGAKGYQIKYSTNKKFKKSATKKINTKASSKTIKKLKSGKKYYVKVRAYNIVNGKKTYGKWSKTLKKTVK